MSYPTSRTRHHDSGSIAAFSVLISAALAALLGLVAEGGQVLSARETAVAEAEQAARVGASVVSSATLHEGLLLDRSSAPVEAAEEAMAADGHPGKATSTGGLVTATVTPFSISTPLLGLAGVSSIQVSAEASARAVAG